MELIVYIAAIQISVASILPLADTVQHSISGMVANEGPETSPVTVALYKLDEAAGGKAEALSKSDFLGGREPFRLLALQAAGEYEFPDLPKGFYSVFAWMDTSGDGKLGFDPPEPFGWFAFEPAGRWGAIDLRRSGVKGADFALRKTTPFPGTPIPSSATGPSPLPTSEARTDHGALRRINGIAVLQLWGTARERGFAHGYLAGKQIIEFFEFYVLEDSWGAGAYERTFRPFLESRLRLPDEFKVELDAVVEGMRASGIDMEVKSLGRDFDRTDLLAVNSYIERRAAFPVEEAGTCTQFAFWGERTRESEIAGGLIAGRNMDGEVDLRKVTVTHFLLFAVDPAEGDRKRWVSAMWPGFVGTISGINEDGLYGMENAGGSGPGPVVGGIVPCSWVQRHVLETAGADVSPETALGIMRVFMNDAGGITAPGSIILWAVPYSRQAAPAFVYEGDRFGGAMRTPGQVTPIDQYCILASNHHLVYGAEADRPGFSFGRRVSFSSLWRYEAGLNTIEAWRRTGRSVGLEEMVRLLQTVAHGTTEYSVIFIPERMKVLVAVDDLEADMWDAPYMRWAEFEFDELFAR